MQRFRLAKQEDLDRVLSHSQTKWIHFLMVKFGLGDANQKQSLFPFGLLRLSLDPEARSVTAQLSRVDVWFGVSLSCTSSAALDGAPILPKP